MITGSRIVLVAGTMMAPLMGMMGMMGMTSGMLGQAIGVAGGSGAAAASGISGALSGAASGLGGLMSSAMGMAPAIAGGAVGVLSAAGQSAQPGVVSPSNPLADGRARESWEIGVAVGAHAVRLRVHGPRQWEPTLKRMRPTWRLGPSKPVTSVPLDYRLAAGGRFAGDPEGETDPRNPIGPGILHADWSRLGMPLKAPQIDGTHAPVGDPFATPQPQGFGPIPPFWLWREKHLGTRDEAWARERCPQMPADLSYRFFQTAHANLILPHLVGDEVVRLDGMIPGGGTLAFALPGVTLVAHHQWRDGRAVDARLTLDGLHLDLRKPEGPWRADLTWRGWMAQCPAYLGASLAWADLAVAAGLPAQGEHGLALAEAAP